MSAMWTVKVLGLAAVALPLGVELLGLLLRRLRPAKTLNEVLFFPSELACVEHIFTSLSPGSCLCPLPHGVETSLSRLLRLVLSAVSSLDLCVFAFSNQNLSRAVLALRARGVAVRILSDRDYVAVSGSQIGVLRKAGICVRCDANSVHMHHKFALVDGRLLITGSLNWTLTAVQSNTENLVVTEEAELVRPFAEEFHRLWERNDPARCLRPK
ncbi:mitochondrial cardiolipin hydrolase isoform X2 [Pseudoliparis swirei]|nr:mitochondrial cardiolipin hydrolase isoform X2 [Pseudoliparis swirei]XP_056265806.1 mitochondrial cardiolipin hydrolase isoform X2 [Pseudoliparis swirei]